LLVIGSLKSIDIDREIAFVAFIFVWCCKIVGTFSFLFLDKKKGKLVPSSSNFRIFSLNRTRKNIIIMSNPVVFFDMEIGGQPAGRIEMTVRRRKKKRFFTFTFSFFFFCVSSSSLSSKKKKKKNHLDHRPSRSLFFF